MELSWFKNKQIDAEHHDFSLGSVYVILKI